MWDDIGRFGPHEGLGVVVVFLELAVDGGLEVGDRAEHAAPVSRVCSSPLVAYSLNRTPGPPLRMSPVSSKITPALSKAR